MRRLAPIVVLAALTGAGCAAEEPGGIDIISVSGPLDALALGFVSDSIEDAAERGSEMALLQLDSPAVLDRPAFERLSGLVAEPPLPLAVWVGPAPARAFGGVWELVSAAGTAAIAPGSQWGIPRPAVLGENGETAGGGEPRPAETSGLPLEATSRQYLQRLDGTSFDTSAGEVVAGTLREFDGGVTLKTTTIREPGWGTRFLRLAATPEATFFFVAVGLAIVTFEIYALGPGVAAGVAALSLVLGGWGVVNLPVRPWALGAIVAGWLVLTAAYQRGGIVLLTLVGAALLQVGGMYFVDGQGQIDPRWWLVLPSVLAVLFFFLLAMPTVQRARLSTQTIGRDGLVGRRGVALVDFSPDGMVEVDEARWLATAHREAGVSEGAEVVVTGVDGLYLEVDRVVTERET